MNRGSRIIGSARVLIGVALAVTLGAASIGSATATTPGGSGPSESATSAAADGCDPLDVRLCFLPFPSDFYTVADPTSATGLRVNLPTTAAPVNVEGVPIDMSEWNRNDGFSPNTTILTYIANLDAEASHLPSWTDLAASLAPNVPVVLVDMATGERVPLWAELDSRAADSPADQLLIIHPAVVLTEAHSYAVGLRGLVDTGGAAIQPSVFFHAVRSEAPVGDEGIDARAMQLEPAFTALESAGVERGDLTLAWSFTVASTENITGRMVHIRDNTLAQLGDVAPEYTITDAVDDPTDDVGARQVGLARIVTGSFTVPNWLTGDGESGQRYHYDVDVSAAPDALPTVNGVTTATFQCNISAAVMADSAPGPVFQYGHGLLGSEEEINAGNQVRLANLSHGVICATKWAGMSEDDVPNAVMSLQDFSNLPTLIDRLQQGVLNQLVLTRLLLAEDGLSADPAFERTGGSRLIDNSRVVYNGNSQGAIMGLMLAGVSTDIDRFVLGVAGMNYGLLLPRSVDFDTYEQILDPAYPDVTNRALILALIQMLWDRGEGSGYVSHVTNNPLEGTPAKTVLVHVAFGDWQVTNLSAMIEARAMGLPINRPVTAEGRSAEVDPGWGLDTLSYPSTGGAIVVWDSGSDPIPIGNEPPSTSRDPHEDPRADPRAQLQIVSFLLGGELVDVCGGGPCAAAPTG